MIVLYILIGLFWCFIIETEVHYWPTEYFWQKNYQSLTVDCFWFYIHHTVVHIWPREHISGQRDLDLILSIHAHWLLLMFHQPDNCPQLLNIFLPEESMNLNFLYIIIYFWCFFSHTEIQIWHVELISDRRVLDLELSIYTYYRLFQIVYRPDNCP